MFEGFLDGKKYPFDPKHPGTWAEAAHELYSVLCGIISRRSLES
jgi:hypothetical protein